MKTRHKPPNLVSMWMLDVFCCALGCVTLLWLLSTREAKLENARNAEGLKNLARTDGERKAALAELEATKALLASSVGDAAELRRVRDGLLRAQNELRATLERAADAKQSLKTELDLLQGKYLALTTEGDETARRLALSRDLILRTEEELAVARTKTAKDRDAAAARVSALEAELAKKLKSTEAAASELRKLTSTADATSLLLSARTKERDDLAARTKAAEDKLLDADGKMKVVVAEARTTAENLNAMRKTTDELTTARTSIIDLMGQKAKLADKFDQLKRDSDSRFAGIAMTGRRVVFLIDMSGSMKLLDDKTPAPTKWNTVVETVGKVVKSIPELELFQVVLFSRKADYLALPGSAGTSWNVYRGEESIRELSAALKAVNPDGDTNLYDGMDLAFRLKPGGLDTIYLFSDGLPTSGPGLSAEQEKTIAAGERSDRLGKHLLRTLRTVWNPPNAARPEARVKINSIGFFFESPEVGAFLWSLSRDNNGSFVGMNQP